MDISLVDPFLNGTVLIELPPLRDDSVGSDAVSAHVRDMAIHNDRGC